MTKHLTKPILSRRQLIKAIVLAKITTFSLLTYAANKPPKKSIRIRTREEVSYQDEPFLGRNCGKCLLYQGDGLCVILEDPVSLNGWCSQWVPGTIG
ncbi:MAG: hypothetical protein ACKVKY_08685 [Burkholderiales bacterium]|jgi:hypothetical protein